MTKTPAPITIHNVSLNEGSLQGSYIDWVLKIGHNRYARVTEILHVALDDPARYWCQATHPRRANMVHDCPHIDVVKQAREEHPEYYQFSSPTLAELDSIVLSYTRLLEQLASLSCSNPLELHLLSGEVRRHLLASVGYIQAMAKQRHTESGS